MWWLAGSLLFPGKLGEGDNFDDIDDQGDNFEGDNDDDDDDVEPICGGWLALYSPRGTLDPGERYLLPGHQYSALHKIGHNNKYKHKIGQKYKYKKDTNTATSTTSHDVKMRVHEVTM